MNNSEVPAEQSSVMGELRKIKIDRTRTSISYDPEYQKTVPLIKNIYRNTELWHGTGRYKYSKNGNVTDILGGLLDDGGIIPHSDNWDRKTGITNTISMAKSRMYARLYAGMFIPNGGRLENELGTRELWGYYFFGTSMITGILEYKPSLKDIRKKGAPAIGDSIVPGGGTKTLEWSGKITKGNPKFTEIFLKGTDIYENYPVLIGIKKGTIHEDKTSRFIALHETRTAQHIPIKNFTHIEVPKEKVEETILLLHKAGYDRIPVIPIEYGEEYCRQFPLRRLVSNKPLI